MCTGPALVVALLVGALTGVALATAVSGTPAEARRAAAALVPATATVTGRSEERVTPWFGGQYVVVLTAEPLSPDQAHFSRRLSTAHGTTAPRRWCRRA